MKFAKNIFVATSTAAARFEMNEFATTFSAESEYLFRPGNFKRETAHPIHHIAPRTHAPILPTVT